MKSFQALKAVRIESKNILLEKVAEKEIERILNEYLIEGTVPFFKKQHPVLKRFFKVLALLYLMRLSLLKQNGLCNAEARNGHPNQKKLRGPNLG